MRALLAIASVLLALGCSDTRDTGVVEGGADAGQGWTLAMLEGFTLELVDHEDTLTLSFDSPGDGLVVDYRSGEDIYVGLGWQWAISDDGDLQIIEFVPPRHDQRVTEYGLKEFAEGRVVVISGGREMVFKRYKTPGARV